jgi:protein AbiQ
VFIKQGYFDKNKHFIEMLDPQDQAKQSSRCYLFVAIKHNGNNFYIPLRENINFSIGNIGYPIPSSTRPNAGLDFRKALIVNDPMYIQNLNQVSISSSQMKKISNDIGAIEKQFSRYVLGYVQAALKGREKIDRLYKFSTLHNFHLELGIN